MSLAKSSAGFSERSSYPPDCLKRYRPLDGLLHAGIDVPERMALRREPFFHRTVVGGTEDAVVERDGIQGNAASFQVCLVFLHQVGTYLVERDITPFPEPHEAVQRRRVGLRRTCLAQPFQTGDDLLHEGEETRFFRRFLKLLHHIIRREVAAVAFQSTDEDIQPLQVTCHAVFDGTEKRLPATGGDCHRMFAVIPFLPENTVIRPYLITRLWIIW